MVVDGEVVPRGAPPPRPNRVILVSWASQFTIDSGADPWPNLQFVGVRRDPARRDEYDDLRLEAGGFHSVDAASEAVIDHTEAPATDGRDTAHLRGSDATWWWGVVIAVHGASGTTDSVRPNRAYPQGC